MKVNKAQLADVLGVSEKTLTEWQKEDPPLPMLNQAGRRGQSNEYETRPVIEWLVQRRMRSAGAETPKDHLLRLQAEEVGLRIAEKRGHLVNLAQLEPMLQLEVRAFKAELESMDDKLTDDLNTVYGIEVDASLIAGHIRTSLIHLARWEKGLNGLPDQGTQAAPVEEAAAGGSLDIAS